MQLVGGSNPYEGRVEVRHPVHGWGTICDDGWGWEEAAVICRMLGLSGVVGTAFFGHGSGPIGYDDLLCRGTEQSISDCEGARWGQHDCNHSEDAGVICGKKHAGIILGMLPVDERRRYVHNDVSHWLIA